MYVMLFSDKSLFGGGKQINRYCLYDLFLNFIWIIGTKVKLLQRQNRIHIFTLLYCEDLLRPLKIHTAWEISSQLLKLNRLLPHMPCMSRLNLFCVNLYNYELLKTTDQRHQQQRFYFFFSNEANYGIFSKYIIF